MFQTPRFAAVRRQFAVVMLGSVALFSASGCAELQRLISELLAGSLVVGTDLDGDLAFRQTSRRCDDPNFSADPNFDDPNGLIPPLFVLTIADGQVTNVVYVENESDAAPGFEVTPDQPAVLIGDLVPAGTSDDFGFLSLTIRIETELERDGEIIRIRVERVISDPGDDPNSDADWITVYEFEGELAEDGSITGEFTSDDNLTSGPCSGEFEAVRE